MSDKRKSMREYLIHIQNLIVLHNPLAIAHYRDDIFSSHRVHKTGNAAYVVKQNIKLEVALQQNRLKYTNFTLNRLQPTKQPNT